MDGEKKRPVLLCADDDENAHILLRRALEKTGVHTLLLETNDGVETIEFLKTEANPTPTVILLDLKMPRVSGFGVLEHLKENPKLKTCPIIAFSSSDHDEDIKRAYALGADYYLVKPTDFHQLMELCRAVDAAFLSKTPREGRPLKDMVVRNPLLAGQPLKKGALGVTPQVAETPEFFRLLVEQVKDYAIFMLDRDGHVLSWNEGARRIKGYEAHEIIGKHFSTFYSRQDLETEKPQFELRMATEMGRYEEEGWRVRKDGSRFWSNVVITALRDREGKLTGFAKVTRDLTQRKMQEENFQRLLESEERFRLLVEQVRDYAIFILDAKGNIASWNQGARRIKGYSSDEIIGKHFSIFYPPEDLAAEKPARELHTAIQEGRYEEEGWRLRKDGTRFWASVVITALWDKRGNLTGFAKVTRDLTDRKREEEALRFKNEELEAFAHTLSHDLRSPLRSICSFSELLKNESRNLSAEEKEYVDKIFRSARSMSALISDVLKLSQVSAVAVRDETVELDDVMKETLELLAGELETAGGTVKIQEPLPTIHGNATLLRQIFANLISNALKFARKGERPTIEITSRLMANECEVQVRDHGVGIRPEFHESIFNVFDRGGASPEFSGTGVGLAIVKRAVERLGGKIRVESVPGEGAAFILTLRCQPEAVHA